MEESEEDKILVSIIMGSKSDWATIRAAAVILEEFGVPHETKIVSAHRTPDLLFEFAKAAESRGIEVIIAGTGRGTPAGYVRLANGFARPRRAGQKQGFEGVGFIALDRSNAGGRAGRNSGDR